MAPETKRIAVEWKGGLKFDGGEPGGPQTLVDGDNAAAPGPMLTLLLAAAACTGSDVVIVLEKMRVGLRHFRMDVAGVRREEEPRRYLSIHFVYDIAGDGLDETKARRAIDLSISKYCSVLHSLAGDIAVTYDLRLA